MMHNPRTSHNLNLGGVGGTDRFMLCMWRESGVKKVGSRRSTTGLAALIGAMFNGEFTIRVRGKKMLVAEVGSTEDVLRVRRAAHEAQISDVRLFTNESAVRQHLLCEGAQEISLAWCHLHQVPSPRDNACDVRDLVPEDYVAWKDCFLWFQSHTSTTCSDLILLLLARRP